MSERRICIFGGTFDPIHNAHLRIALEAVKRFQIDRLLFVPAGNPPHKEANAVTPYEDRFRMVQTACEPYPMFTVSRMEEGRSHSYTVETLQRFRQEMGEGDRLFFLIGSDAFDELHSWHQSERVVRLTEFIVVERPGHQYRIADHAIVHRLDGLALPVSSSGIRERLAKGKPTPELPVKVRKYIEDHGLYGSRRTNLTASR
ncbi:MAG TPA: nicotinate-nucleotide adenylyltransferase [Bryobacteraceae bacterium]|nr:nicotinate-nucleotide adenylyltransferase [Bryobacteraceae bacterium]